MPYRLGKRSQKRLVGLDEPLVATVHDAILIVSVDFTVLEGLRTLERQKKLFQSGASRTMKSGHLIGEAVDLGAYVDGTVRWEMPLYVEIALAIKEAAKKNQYKMKWGAVWDRRLGGYIPSEDEIEAYAKRYRKRRKDKGLKPRGPLIDGPHFQKAN